MSKMRRIKLPKDVKARKRLAKCLEEAGWPSFDIRLLLGYSVVITGRLNSVQNMIYTHLDTRKMMVKHYLESYDIRAEM